MGIKLMYPSSYELVPNNNVCTGVNYRCKFKSLYVLGGMRLYSFYKLMALSTTIQSG